MRVVHLSSQHRPRDVRIFCKECRTLANHGYDVHLLIRDAEPGKVDGVRFHRFEWPESAFRPARIGQRLWRMVRQARALRGDLYHFHDPELIVVGLLLKQDGAKVIYDVHEDTPREALTLNKDRPLDAKAKSWAWSGLETLARRAFDAFVCATPAIARHFPAQRTATVRNYPLLEEMSRGAGEGVSPLAQRPAHVAYVGGITRPRGIVQMLDALNSLPASSQVRLQLAGELLPGTWAEEVQRHPGWIRTDHHGQLGRTDIWRLMASVRVGLVLLHPEPIHLDSLPVKLFEYMAAGLPVVASDFPYWRSIVEGIGCGLVVNPLDPAAIAAAITWLLEHSEESAVMGRRGMAAVREQCNWEAEAGKLIGLYQRLESPTASRPDHVMLKAS